MNKNIAASILCALASLVLLSACAGNGTEGEAMSELNGGEYTAESRIDDVMADPAFGDYGRLLFPVEREYMSGDTLGSLGLTWYSYIDPDETVEIVNTLRERAAAGDTVFFRGDEGAPFAVCSAGGAFAYVGAMQDSFPHALELSKRG